MHTTTAPARTTEIAAARGGTRGNPALIVLGIGRWRVLGDRGAIVGLVEERATPRGVGYRARRYRWRAREFVDVGDFWRLEDAVASLRAS